MSTVEHGDARIAADAVEQSKKLLAEALAEEEQLELLAPPSPEEIADAREELGDGAGNLTVLRFAREKKKGRPTGTRNRRTDDFARYILGFGQDPAITMMQIQATPPEVLIENSKRIVKQLNKAGVLVEIESTMTYQEAQSLRIRCAEGLMPFVHSKQPVSIDTTIRGVRVIEEIGGHGIAGLIDGGELRNARPDEFAEAAE